MATASNQELTRQCLTLNQEVNALRDLVHKANAEIIKLRNESPEPGEGSKTTYFLDRKRRVPDDWRKGTPWREFSENFVEWVSGIDAAAGDKLEAALDTKDVISGVGMSTSEQHAAREVFIAMKTMLKDNVEAKGILRKVQKNPYEAWRLLNESSTHSPQVTRPRR